MFTLAALIPSWEDQTSYGLITRLSFAGTCLAILYLNAKAEREKIQSFQDETALASDRRGDKATHHNSGQETSDRLLEREALFRSIFDQGAIGIAILDEKLHFKSVNGAFANFLEYEESALNGSPHEAVVPAYSLGSLKNRYERTRDKAQTEGPFEQAYRTRKGEIRTGLATLSYLAGTNNLPSSYIYVVQDISSQKSLALRLAQERQRFADFTFVASDWYWEFDEELRFNYLSDRFSFVTGIKRDNLLGKTFEATGAQTSDAESLQRHLEDLRAYRPFRDFRYLCKKPSGADMWLSTSGKPFFDKNGHFLGYRGVGRDITNDVAAEEREAAMRAQLAHAQKLEAIGQLTGGISHDFNNLLAIIGGNAELLTYRLPQEGDCLDAIIRAANRGAELTQRLLAFSRQQPLQPRLTSFKELSQDMLDLLQRTLGATIEIQLECNSGDWLVHVDPGQLENALLNLAINARDAMPDGGLLKFNCHKHKAAAEAGPPSKSDLEPGDYLVISVKDNGSGIPEELLERVFEPFYTTKPIGKGSGMGLPMVYGFAKQSGGNLVLESKVGFGTTVSLYLPRGIAEAITKAEPKQKGAPSGAGETILLIEDDPHVREMTRKMLDSLGYEVVQAQDAVEAEQRLSDHPEISVLLSDIILPGSLDGYSFTKRAQSLRPDLRALFMSGYNAPNVIQPDPDAPLLQKPFRRAELARRLSEVIQSPPKCLNQPG